MPIRKFHSIEEMKTPRWRQPGDPEILRALAALLEIGRRTNRRRFPPGVHRYATIEEMQQTQEQWAKSRTTPTPDSGS
jgi:hypothetical protein